MSIIHVQSLWRGVSGAARVMFSYCRTTPDFLPHM